MIMTKKLALGFAALLMAAGTGCSSQPSHQANTMTPLEAGSTDGEIKNVKPNANTHFAAGQLAEAQGDMGDAIDQYKFALRLDPANANSMFRLGVIYTGLRKYPLAFDMWKQYLKATNNSATGYSNLA